MLYSFIISPISHMSSVVRIFPIFCFALLLVACGDPHDTKIPDDISKWSTSVKPALQKLTLDEQALFTQYVRRHTTAATVGLVADQTDPIPEGMTLGKAIEEQRSYLAREQAQAVKEKAPSGKKP